MSELTMKLRIDSTPFDGPAAVPLLAAVQADLAERYGSGDATPVDAGEFTLPHGDFLVARCGGESVGCGGWRTLAATSSGDGATAEIKRMYTVPAHRGRGVARMLLRAIEDSARAAGMRRAVLETGYAQPEAIALYERCGYERIPNFGYYRDEPGCVCFGRAL